MRERRGNGEKREKRDKRKKREKGENKDVPKTLLAEILKTIDILAEMLKI